MSSIIKKILYAYLIIIILCLIKSQYDYSDYGTIFDNEQRASYYWGTYKPNLYFAMKNRLNTSINFGIMWYGADEKHFHRSGNITERIRHNCRMEDELKYRWEIHNSKDYGNQVIEDPNANIKLTTEFIKTRYSSFKNQSWDVNIEGIHFILII